MTIFMNTVTAPTVGQTILRGGVTVRITEVVRRVGFSTRSFERSKWEVVVVAA